MRIEVRPFFADFCKFFLDMKIRYYTFTLTHPTQIHKIDRIIEKCEEK